MASPGDRHDPLPGLLDVPAWARRNLSRRVRRGILAAALALAVGLAVAIPLLLSAQSEREERGAAEDRARLVERRREIVRAQAPRVGRVRAARGRPLALTRALEAAVLADARARRRAGELPGRVREVRCAPFDPSARARPGELVLECLAGSGGTGFPFRARVAVRTGTFTWCRNVPAPLGAAEELSLPLSPRCTGRP